MDKNNYTRDDLIDYMGAFDMDELPDGAWFSVLEEGGKAFIKEFNVKGKDGNDIAHEYLNFRSS